MDDGIRLLTLQDFYNCLKANNVGDFQLFEKLGELAILITFRNVKWWQILRKKRIQKAVDFINIHKPMGLEIKVYND